MLGALAAALALLSAPPDSLPAADDTTATSPRVVRVLEAFEVRAPLLHDPLSSETVQRIGGREFWLTPADGLAAVVGLRAGVVETAGELHVRGGRAGDVQMSLAGIGLNDALRDRPMEIPLPALESVDLVSGGMDADYGGALAGVLDLTTRAPSADRWSGELRWEGDGGTGTRFDRAAGRLSGPLGLGGLSASVATDVTLDDTHLPALRSQGRRELLGASVGWRADNHALGHLKIAASPARAGVFALDVLASRRLEQPFDLMWSLDGYTRADDAPFGPRFSPDPQPGFARYRAADHAVMIDERRMAAVLSWARGTERWRSRAALGWVGSRRLVSVGGRDDEDYLTVAHFPVFGLPESGLNDPLFVYQGDEPFFQRGSGQTLTLRADHEVVRRRGATRVRVGVGGTYQGVRMRELDVSQPGVDLLRGYEAYAPGAFVFGQTRWAFEGLMLNAGLRGELFTAGPQAERQSFGAPARAIVSFSPRLGVAYPISASDVFSLAYVRVQQNPGRDFLYDNRRNITNRQPLGNPGLEPASLISYQAGLKHALGLGWSAQGSVFYRDLFGQVGARFEDLGGAPRLRYQNADEGHASGFELTVVRGAPGEARLELNYTYMLARGTQSLEEGTPYGARIGVRPGPIGEHPLDWDRRHSIALGLQHEVPGRWALAWSTRLGSGLPWTPRARRLPDASDALVNGERFGWDETTSLAARWWPWWLRGAVGVGLEVRNLFDHRSEAAATLDGYPNPEINTVYDDYGAYRTETGHSGGAYWDDVDGDGIPGWVPVHDPRLFQAPRTVRASLSTRW
jgi:hypothetical protein